MKIGAFAASHGVSIDTVRHYIDIGLLLPEKYGGQYSFDDSCGKDLEEINSLKAMGFTLAEIRTVFLFRKLGRMTSNRQDTFLQELFVSKQTRISELLEELKMVSGRLEEKIREMDQTAEGQPRRLGMRISSLGLVQCPMCGGKLDLAKATIENNQIMDGSLLCKCGYDILIRDGILYSRETAEAGKSGELDESGKSIESGEAVESDASGRVVRPERPNKPDRLERSDKSGSFTEIDGLAELGGVVGLNRISDYIRNTDETYLKNVYKSLEWVHRRLNDQELGGKVLLELGSGLGFFLRLIYEGLPEDTLYIAVDHDPGMQKFLKSLLEHSGKQKNILFLCMDFLQIPLREKSADVVLDLTGTSNYAFGHEEFLLRHMLRYFHEDSTLLGSYILFGNFSPDTRIAPGFRKNFRMETVRRELAALGFDVEKELVTDYIAKGGVYEGYFTDRERVNSLAVYAKRSGAHEVSGKQAAKNLPEPG